MPNHDSSAKSGLDIHWSPDGKIATISIDLCAVTPLIELNEPEALRLILAGFKGDDPAAAGAAFEWVVSPDATKQLLRAAIEAPMVDDKMQAAFHLQWTVRGFRMREDVSDDTLLAEALRRLLPPYDGLAHTLYRGEQAARFARGEVGFGWTQDRSVAEMFASGLCTTYAGGGVLLEAAVPTSAIIAGPSDHSSYLGEKEYVVDPRCLGPIIGLAYFAQTL